MYRKPSDNMNVNMSECVRTTSVDKCASDSDSVCDSDNGMAKQIRALMTVNASFSRDGFFRDMPPIETADTDDDSGNNNSEIPGESSEPEAIDIRYLRENRSWQAMTINVPRIRPKVRTLLDSGCSCSIFTERSLFTDYMDVHTPIITAGGKIYAIGMGTVGKLRNCLHVPNMNIQLISAGQVCEDIDDIELCQRRGTFTIRGGLTLVTTPSLFPAAFTPHASAS